MSLHKSPILVFISHIHTQNEKNSISIFLLQFLKAELFNA